MWHSGVFLASTYSKCLKFTVYYVDKSYKIDYNAAFRPKNGIWPRNMLLSTIIMKLGQNDKVSKNSGILNGFFMNSIFLGQMPFLFGFACCALTTKNCNSSSSELSGSRTIETECYKWSEILLRGILLFLITAFMNRL